MIYQPDRYIFNGIQMSGNGILTGKEFAELWMRDRSRLEMNRFSYGISKKHSVSERIIANFLSDYSNFISKNEPDLGSSHAYGSKIFDKMRDAFPVLSAVDNVSSQDIALYYDLAVGYSHMMDTMVIARETDALHNVTLSEQIKYYFDDNKDEKNAEDVIDEKVDYIMLTTQAYAYYLQTRLGNTPETKDKIRLLYNYASQERDDKESMRDLIFEDMLKHTERPAHMEGLLITRARKSDGSISAAGFRTLSHYASHYDLKEEDIKAMTVDEYHKIVRERMNPFLGMDYTLDNDRGMEFEG